MALFPCTEYIHILHQCPFMQIFNLKTLRESVEQTIKMVTLSNLPSFGSLITSGTGLSGSSSSPGRI